MKSKKLLKKIGLLIMFTFIICNVQSQETVTFSINNLANGLIEPGSGSINSCWVLDSDIERPRNTSNEDRWAEMGLGSVRYPYGHLAENYLWDTPPYGGTLDDKVASLNKAPGNYSWAVNPDRTMKKSMDFDEFMAICQRKNIKPLVVINTQGHLINGSQVTYEELKTTAVEWVKYAKDKNYDVAYWQIGNEVDHGSALYTTTEYIDLYRDFVTAMKAEDPTIICGPGIHSKINFFNAFMASNIDITDFTSAHQYLFGSSIIDYDTWLNHDGSDLNPNIEGIQNGVNNTSKPDLPILITETNAFGNWQNSNGNTASSASIYKGLAWFDMYITQQKFEDVKYSFIWNSHSLWSGENGNDGVANALKNTMDNEITPMGMPIKIFNTTAEERYMIPDNKVHGKTYSYGTYTPATGNSTIYLLNKSTSSVTMNVNIGNYNLSSNYERWAWESSGDQYSETSTFTETGTISFTSSGFSTNVPAYSLVVVKLNGNEIAQVSDLENFFDNVGSGLRMKSNSANNDVISVAVGDNDLLAQWEIIEISDGYVFIQNKGNGMRLQGSSSNTGVHTSVKLASGTSNGDWVKWKLTPLGANWVIDNKAHNTRLGVSANGEIIVSPITDTDTMVQWGSNNTLSVSETVVDSNEILIYPNSIKSGDYFNLRYTLKSSDDVLKIRIIDVSGKVILNKEETLRSGLNKIKIESNGLSQGLYFVELSSNRTRLTKKIVIN